MIECALIIGIILLAWRLHEVDKIMKNYDRNMIEMFNEFQQVKIEIDLIETNLEATRRKADHCLAVLKESK